MISLVANPWEENAMTVIEEKARELSKRGIIVNLNSKTVAEEN